MEILNTAMSIITGPWDVITWIIVLMLGSSVATILYRLAMGKPWNEPISSKIKFIEDSNKYNFYDFDKTNRINETYWNGRH